MISLTFNVFVNWADASTCQKRQKESQGGGTSKKLKRSHKTLSLHPRKNHKTGKLKLLIVVAIVVLSFSLLPVFIPYFYPPKKCQFVVF